MKPTTNTTQKAESRPVGTLAGGGDAAAENASVAEVVPPADAGGSASPADIDSLRAENEQLKEQIRLSKAHRQITGELERAGARSPELLFDSVRGDLQFADDGELTNAAAIVTRLRSGYPEQFGHASAASIDGGAGASRQPQLTREVLSRMKPSQIAELDWNDVRRVLSS